ncbi:MAG: 23S rRNA (cytidine(2498)-2'-O)-methyltransferase RlmM [Xanthomonadales bacterium]|nr:23S rRNA (cytidine(2498)-2'-O)-methyltransferase RlmM [Xanthomonadales bacterium]MCP5475276.1 23S rRNA (cytidine(2498)-2'-O)-methyltransferase RlmM [Rhodanobacteraceae bacterium]
MTDTTALPELALLCRVGFEPDLMDELVAWFAAQGMAASVWSEQSAVVRVRAAGGHPRLPDLVFARDLMRVTAELRDLSVKDRVSPISAALRSLSPYSALTVLTPDSETTKPLAPLVGALQARLGELIHPSGVAQAQVWMLAGTHALVGSSPPDGAAAFAGGIPRLKFPREAPSRSTLKLEEAFQVLMSAEERADLLGAGGGAVDLGAAPGGWTYQLVARRIRVTAIDNGPMAPTLIHSGLVQHLREDGFRYRPPRPVDWLVCDMVEKPGKVAELMVRWLQSGWCKAAVFNLKLPMKKRFDAWNKARAVLQPLHGMGFSVRARQLYHDREELTVAVIPGARVQLPKLREAAGSHHSNRANRSQPSPAAPTRPAKGSRKTAADAAPQKAGQRSGRAASGRKPAPAGARPSTPGAKSPAPGSRKPRGNRARKR